MALKDTIAEMKQGIEAGIEHFADDPVTAALARRAAKSFTGIFDEVDAELVRLETRIRELEGRLHG